ncbi:MAG: hypothetical protein NC302_03720 [Bacteroidales bacterium]|nr:hypothetical protein [Bacteroidales bacterium]
MRYGVGIYNDSEQYITMHIHREPLYPLFLALFRKLCGERYLPVAAAVQGILAALGIWVLTGYLAARFRLRLWEELLLTAVQLAPHLVTRYVSAMHIFMENSVMSEALCLPLFSFFLYFLLRMLLEENPRDAAFSLLFAWLLSMTRGQMMTTILLTALLLGCKLILNKKYRMLFIPIAAVVFAFVMRILAVHLYNYGVTGYFIGNTYGKVNTLTNVIYACDEEDRTVFPEGSLGQMFFDQFYAQSVENGWNHRYGGSSFGERAAHLEESHDRIKFDVVEAGFSAYYYARGEDYYGQSLKADEVAAEMIKKLLPACFGQWLYDYILLVWNGFVRSIAVVHPLLDIAALFLYLTAAGLTGFLVLRAWRAGRETTDLSGRQTQPLRAAVVMGVALLFIAANVCATSLTIMCLSRYMIYGFSLFYMAFYLILREVKHELQRNHI